VLDTTLGVKFHSWAAIQWRSQPKTLGAGLRGAIVPGPPWWNLFVSNKVLVWKIS